ncbi:unnamed protein product [Paramecium primaurelia]|uniref:Uncharacterized protein n=1 Tax=Paramecium primaurelia TaxID=5886 RepID=A0A8S1LC54_PARPR|nr:unnamed protein product [Paramecium primaurelia]
MSSKKQKKVQKAAEKGQQISTNRGKPSDIEKTKLQIPNIWTNDQTCLRLIKYLNDVGRHNCLHQAGKPNPDDKYKTNKSEIENTREYYEISERFAAELFGHKCDTKRCIVFFFRPSGDEKFNNFDWIKKQKLDCHDVLIKLSAQFAPKFFKDLLTILTSNISMSTIVDLFLQNGKTPQSYSSIIQNLYIKQMIDTMKQKQSKQQFLEMKKRADMESDFYSFIQSQFAKDELEKFIKEIRQIFNREIDQYEPQYFENDIQEIDNFQQNQNESLFQEDLDFQREYNYFIQALE